ncbi:uncharacterized protein G2W53_033109 [Senna tora]|uniref:Uncharacterized protein n=1 Tax=Senna tora TaxID=362788 RepID=A0A834W871_9FABA|nr:uncharacterized protein G2W53_033109 [Senna tora]
MVPDVDNVILWSTSKYRSLVRTP